MPLTPLPWLWDWWFQVFLDNTIGLPGGAYLNNYHNNAFGTVSANGPAKFVDRSD